MFVCMLACVCARALTWKDYCVDGGRALFMFISLCSQACGSGCCEVNVVKRNCLLCTGPVCCECEWSWNALCEMSVYGVGRVSRGLRWFSKAPDFESRLYISFLFVFFFLRIVVLFFSAFCFPFNFLRTTIFFLLFSIIFIILVIILVSWRYDMKFFLWITLL